MQAKVNHLKRLAKYFWGRYRITGGENDGKIIYVLDKSELKKAWLEQRYGDEFERIFGNYQNTPAYIKYKLAKKHGERNKNTE